jgi:hypothetical protein
MIECPTPADGTLNAVVVAARLFVSNPKTKNKLQKSRKETLNSEKLLSITFILLIT